MRESRNSRLLRAGQERARAGRASPWLKGLLIAAVALWLFPVYWIVLTSLKPLREINTAVPSLHFSPTLQNYKDLFAGFDFLNVLVNSTVVVFVSCFIVMLLGMLSAYALARMQVRGAKHIALWILSMRFIPTMAVGIPFYLEWQTFDLLDSYTGSFLSMCPSISPSPSGCCEAFSASFPKNSRKRHFSTACQEFRSSSGSFCP